MSSETVNRHTNRLMREKSPYLLQHAHNPVDWYPWGTEAFEKARKEEKPVFLSIGYSTCHWCHVMEKESFEDPEVARLMNEVFVSIKVDREERPDIDTTYMTVCQMLTGSGGWPLTIVMTPDRKPFFAGTYFPKESRFGRIGMTELVPRIEEVWRARQDDVLSSADQITTALKRASQETPGETLGEATLRIAYNQLDRRFDEEYGGFGQGNKFPTPHNLMFLLRYRRRTGQERSLLMLEKTLQAMRCGGVYDHVGFGFHRYSTDATWLVPHFEKMLYDQAMLAMAYTEAYLATGKGEYGQTAREVFTYILRDMTAPMGGFYSSEDADSEGKEGKFYLWTEEEIRHILDREEADLISRVWNV
ncbi:MAG: thioredoxin domain-containing protein, partial [Candidatus Latescibacteria bacterium]|nr:thioredoxin domain-containing protein [Candidatus Latescibacterota bacterium]